jgi:transposase
LVAVESERELVVRTAGALPVVKALCDRLGLVEVVDRFCPIRSVADYSHGQVVEALVCNRLTHPRPLSSFIDWGERFAVHETLGIASSKLNDDRLGRTLDAVADHLDEMLGVVARRAVERFGLELAELHWDLTQLSFTGSYAEQEDAYPQVKYGRTPKRTIERQVHAGLWVAADGAVPVRGLGFDGNSEDRQTVTPALERLDRVREALPAAQPPLVVGDSKLLSAGNVVAFEQRQLRFLCPHPKDAPLQRRLAELEQSGFHPLAYAAERHRDEPPRYLAQEGTLTVAGKELRALFVLSLDDQGAARKQRVKQRSRAEEELARLNRGVSHFRRSAAEVERRARAILERRRLDRLLQLTVTEESGQPQAHVELDREALAAAERLDGRYCLVSNDRALSRDELFLAYKRQHLIESRFADFKGPLAVRPIFLHSNRRIAALVAIVSLALLLYGLIEREVRRGLASLNAAQQHLLAERIGRATGRKILDQLSDLAAVRARDGPTRLARPRPVQQLLLQLLAP